MKIGYICVLLALSAALLSPVSLFADETGIEFIRVHPKLIRAGDEVTVNIKLKGEFLKENPKVEVFVGNSRVADNFALAEQDIAISPGISLKFRASENIDWQGGYEIKVVMYYDNNKYSRAYYPDSQYKDFCADAPWRVEGANSIVPIEAIILDGDAWSCNLDWVRIKDVNNGYAAVAEFDAGGMEINTARWSHLFSNLRANQFEVVDDHIDILVHIHYRELIIIPYDFRQFLRVKIAARQFPDAPGWYYGDTHYHTSFTDNYYESGGSFGMISSCGQVLGLDWMVTTDHASNNSGDQFPIGEFANDLEEHEWGPLGDSCSIYSTPDFKIIRGEEVTIKNDAAYPGDDGANDNTAHMLTIGNTDYIEGPIGPDAYFEDDDHSNLTSLTSRLELLEPMPSGIAFAAHPLDAWPVPVFEDIIPWSSAMYDTAFGFSSFIGLQFYNERNAYFTDDPEYVNPDEYINPFPVWQPQAAWDSSFIKGLVQWDSLLCANLNPIRKIFAAGGSDAHGDFNYRYTGMTLLFFSFLQITDDAYGKVRTAVYCPDGMGNNGENILDALANGVSIVTDGPFIIFGIDSDGNGSVFDPNDAIIGGTAHPPGISGNPKLVSYWKSTPEFGAIEYVKLVVGTSDGISEYYQNLNNYGGYISLNLLPLVPQGYQRFYIRLEAWCSDNDGIPGYRCITNPIWIDLSGSGIAEKDRSKPNKTDQVINKLLFGM